MTKIIIEGQCVHTNGVRQEQVEIDTSTGLINRVGNNLGNPTSSFPKTHLIFAGFGDIHIHAREDETGQQNYKEDYQSATAAALHGGVTHVACMPNTPAPLTTEEQLRWHQQKCRSFPVSFLHYVGVGPDTFPLSISVPYKVFTGPSVGKLFFKNELELRKVLQNYRGQQVSFHVEDYDILEANKTAHTHQERRPVACVEKALAYVLAIIEEYDLKAKLCHWSTAGKSITMITQHRAKGFNTTLEVSPLHLYFDADMLTTIPEFWPYVQMNPSIQGQEHRRELLRLLKEGFIDYVATDHAPHTLAEKFKQFEPPAETAMSKEEYYLHLKEHDIAKCREFAYKDSTSGTPQLDTYALIAAWLMKEQGFSPEDIARVCAQNPGSFMNQFHAGRGKFGKIEQGYYGSFTVLDMSVSTTVTRKELKTKCGWSPFEGITFPGRVAATFVKGILY